MAMERREFLAKSIAGVGGLLLGKQLDAVEKQQPRMFEPYELVPLGKTKIKVSRVGLGTGMRGFRRQSNHTNGPGHVRINPYAVNIDVKTVEEIPKVEAAIKAMRKQGKAVVVMKIFAAGAFRDSAEKREKSIKYALKSGCMDAMVVGFETIGELDDFAAGARKVPVPNGPKQLIAYGPARVM